MRYYLLPAEGNFYKANLHTHTNLSDGDFSPEEIKKMYSEKGYSIVAYTDHELMIPHNDLTDESFLAITGVEYAKNKGDYNMMPSLHINIISKDKNKCTYPGFNKRKIWKAIEHMKAFLTEEMNEYDGKVPSYNDEDLNELIAQCNAEGFLVCFNHPNGSLQNFRDYGNLKGLWGMECHNGGPAIGGFPESMNPIVELHREGEKVLPVAADDTHSSAQLFGGFNMIKAKSLDYDTIIEALVNGDFYASQAPKINELYVEDGVVHVETSEAQAIILHTMQRFNRKVYANNDELLTKADIDIKPFLEECALKEKFLPYGNFIRIEVIDKDCKRAYTRCYYLNEFSEEK